MADKPTHPDVPGCVVRFTDEAISDLEALFRVDPQIVRWVLKKTLVIERDPNAGEPLLGGLVGYRKIVVSDRDWRVVWRVVEGSSGEFHIEVAEVWAVGYRKDSEIYAEIQSRIAQADNTIKTTPLSDVLEIFAKQARGLQAVTEPEEEEPVPVWLLQSLRFVVGLPLEEVEQMSLAQAERAWNGYITGPGSAR